MDHGLLPLGCPSIPETEPPSNPGRSNSTAVALGPLLARISGAPWPRGCARYPIVDPRPTSPNVAAALSSQPGHSLRPWAVAPTSEDCSVSSLRTLGYAINPSKVPGIDSPCSST
jgi:hypothetical protein